MFPFFVSGKISIFVEYQNKRIMAYKKEELLKAALEAIESKKLFFIEDIIPYLPCRKSTFYEHFPVESNEYKDISRELIKNRMALKVSMRKKWFTSDNATLQLALYRLIASDEERVRLNQQFMDISTKGQPITKVTLSDKQKDELLDNLIPKRSQ